MLLGRYGTLKNTVTHRYMPLHFQECTQIYNDLAALNFFIIVKVLGAGAWRVSCCEREPRISPSDRKIFYHERILLGLSRKNILI